MRQPGCLQQKLFRGAGYSGNWECTKHKLKNMYREGCFAFMTPFSIRTEPLINVRIFPLPRFAIASPNDCIVQNCTDLRKLDFN